jgi:hypothetical protein
MNKKCKICGAYFSENSSSVCPDCKKPCDSCKKVKDPEACENKYCKEWGRWWIRRWNLLRMFNLPKEG